MDKNLVVRLGTTWLCDIKRVVVVWMVWATCVVRHFMLCDHDREPPNVVHFKRNLCDIMVSQRCSVLSDVIWTYFCHFLRRSRAKFIKKIVDVWMLVAQQLFAWPRHVLCRTTLLYKVVWLNCCLCGRTLTHHKLRCNLSLCLVVQLLEVFAVQLFYGLATYECFHLFTAFVVKQATKTHLQRYRKTHWVNKTLVLSDNHLFPNLK